MPKISVLMSVYNNAPTVAHAIKSILSQSLQYFELIIVDDASTDNSPAIIKSLASQDARVKIITNEKNAGLAVSLNQALEQARGEYIARHDGHATSRPSRFATQVAYLDEHPKVNILGTATPEITPPEDDEKIKRVLRHKNCIIHGSVMMRAKTLKDVGGYNPQYRYVQDYELWRRLAKSGAVFANLAEPLYILDRAQKSVAVTAEKLTYLMNALQDNQTVLPLSHLPLIRKLQFCRYMTRYFIKRFFRI